MDPWCLLQETQEDDTKWPVTYLSLPSFTLAITSVYLILPSAWTYQTKLSFHLFFFINFDCQISPIRWAFRWLQWSFQWRSIVETLGGFQMPDITQKWPIWKTLIEPIVLAVINWEIFVYFTLLLSPICRILVSHIKRTCHLSQLPRIDGICSCHNTWNDREWIGLVTMFNWRVFRHINSNS